MGERINYVFSEGEGKPAVVLYSHWGATDWQEDLAFALNHAAARIEMGDTSYAVRNIISYLTRDYVMSETGFGIYAIANPEDFQAWDLTVVVDMVNKVVDGHSFTDFSNYHMGVTHA